ncbi:hypothetical protein JTE90_007973 [Oedothorax gibbosus]|uniref:Uncharacterized protein n=1 Tax=Oedothorax gibbosus TaxID=931172 RepID=A0AAV6UMB9_9ARAC|nr:hypothetical protein JTE90_007973 [Oedothorax gibbosus]
MSQTSRFQQIKPPETGTRLHLSLRKNRSPSPNLGQFVNTSLSSFTRDCDECLWIAPNTKKGQKMFVHFKGSSWDEFAAFTTLLDSKKKSLDVNKPFDKVTCQTFRNMEG